jgi:ParB-like chromosome segregation protein Spo0J
LAIDRDDGPGSGLTYRPIGDLRAYARNSRTHTAEQVLEIAGSIRGWGWTMPVLVDPTGEIIAGHGRVLAADLIYQGRDGNPAGTLRMATGEAIPAGMIPVLIAAGWTPEQTRAYVIADNKIGENAGWDQEILRVELNDLRELGVDLGTLGFDEADLRELAIGVEALGAMPELNSGERSEFREMTFVLLADQADAVAEAVKLAVEVLGPLTDANRNQNRNGNGLAEVCRAYLAAAHDDEPDMRPRDEN